MTAKRVTLFAVVESRYSRRITTLTQGAFILRVWRDEDNLDGYYDNEDIAAVVDKYLGRQEGYKHFEQHELIGLVAALPRVSAVEVTDQEGNGVVVYSSWP